MADAIVSYVVMTNVEATFLLLRPKSEISKSFIEKKAGAYPNEILFLSSYLLLR